MSIKTFRRRIISGGYVTPVPKYPGSRQKVIRRRDLLAARDKWQRDQTTIHVPQSTKSHASMSGDEFLQIRRERWKEFDRQKQNTNR
jgi:hypothetical protein